MNKELARSAEIAIRECMAVKPGETVLIVTDEPTRSVGRAFWEKAVEAGAEAIYMEITPRKNDGIELPALIGEAMKRADVIIGPTSRSFSHTIARREACKAGARIATLPGVTEDIVQRTLGADYESIALKSKKFADVLTEGKLANLTTPAGTELSMSLEGRAGNPDTGIIHKPGDFSNLPAGEAYIAPVENTASGTIIIDGAMAGIGVLENPIKLTVEAGYVVKIEGGKEAAKLEAILKEYGKPAYNIAELGIGTNDKAILVGKVIEDEKVMGTVHIALGNSFHIGGKVEVPIHLDAILMNPTLIIDEKMIIKDGKHCI